MTTLTHRPTFDRLRARLASTPEAIALITLGGVFVFFALSAEDFLTPLALSNVLTFAAGTGVIALGVAMLMIAGEFDLSVGAVLAVAGYTFALLLNAGAPPILALAAALAAGALLGLFNGLIVTRTGIPSFITTLGTMLAYRGLARAIGGGAIASFSGEKGALFGLLNGAFEPLNAAFTPAANFRASMLWFAGLGIALSVVLLRTRWGNWVFATGGDPAAARAQGVPVQRVKIAAFVLSGTLAAFAGVMGFAMRPSIDPLRGEGIELVAVAAAVIGGVRLTGGFGTLAGAAVGVLLLSMLEQGLVLLNLPIQVFRAAAGVILVLAVAVNTALARRG